MRNFGVVGVLSSLLLLSVPSAGSAQSAGVSLAGRLSLAASDTDLPPTAIPEPPKPVVQAPRPQPAPVPDNWHPDTKLALTYDDFSMKYGSTTSNQGVPFPSGKFEGAGFGVHGFFDWWGLGVWKVSGKFKEEGSTGSNWDLIGVAVNVGSVGKSIVDGGGPKFRIGLYYPEVSVRYSWGSKEGSDFSMLNIAASVVTLRTTFGDTVFAEVRAGSLSWDSSTFDFTDPTTGARDTDETSDVNFAISPSFRLGLIF